MYKINTGTEQSIRESIDFLFGKEVVLYSRKGLLYVFYCGKKISPVVWKSWQDRFVPISVVAKQYRLPIILFNILKFFL
jgi:hypothetical protein